MARQIALDAPVGTVLALRLRSLPARTRDAAMLRRLRTLLSNTLVRVGLKQKPAPPLRFEGYYDDWRKKRILGIVGHYGPEFFQGKTVLELGCGYAGLGATFAELGARVTDCDARAEHLREARRRHPALLLVQANLDREWPFSHFDLILHMGLLHHLRNYERHLASVCASCEHL